MSNLVDVSECTEGIRITIIEARVIMDTNSSVFLFTDDSSLVYKDYFNITCQKVLVLKTKKYSLKEGLLMTTEVISIK